MSQECRQTPLGLLLFPQQVRAHRRRQGQRHEGRDHDSGRQCEGELAKQAADHAAQAQKRDQGDLFGPLDCRANWREPGLDVPRDVFDHHDCVVDDEPGGDGERHQREVVQAETAERHDAECADERKRQSRGRNDGRPSIAEKQENHDHHEGDGEAERELHIMDRGTDCLGSIGQDGELDCRRKRRAQVRQQPANPLAGLDDVRPGLTLDGEHDRRLSVEPAAYPAILDAVEHRSDVCQPDRGAIAIGNDDVAISLSSEELSVRRDRVGAVLSVEITLGPGSIGLGDCVSHLLETETESRDRDRVDLDAHGTPLLALDGDQPDAFDPRQLLDQPSLGDIVQLGQGHAVGGKRQQHDRRIGRVDLAVGRRSWKVAW